MERIETPAFVAKAAGNRNPVPVAAAPAPYSATARRARTASARAAGADRIVDARGLVCRSRPGMPARWSAAAFLEIERRFRKIMGYRDLWALKAILDGPQQASRQAVA